MQDFVHQPSYAFGQPHYSRKQKECSNSVVRRILTNTDLFLKEIVDWSIGSRRLMRGASICKLDWFLAIIIINGIIISILPPASISKLDWFAVFTPNQSPLKMRSVLHMLRSWIPSKFGDFIRNLDEASYLQPKLILYLCYRRSDLILRGDWFGGENSKSI